MPRSPPSTPVYMHQQVVSSLDDDNPSTRLVSCKVLQLLLMEKPRALNGLLQGWGQLYVLSELQGWGTFIIVTFEVNLKMVAST